MDGVAWPGGWMDAITLFVVITESVPAINNRKHSSIKEETINGKRQLNEGGIPEPYKM